MFEANEKPVGIVRLDKYMAHMSLGRWARETPVFFHLRRQFLNPGELLPRLPTVLAPVKMNRFGADINDFLIYRIDGDGPDIAFENSAPTLARIVGAVKTILGDAEKNHVWLGFQTADGGDGSTFNGHRRFDPGASFRTPPRFAPRSRFSNARRINPPVCRHKYELDWA